MKLRIVMCAERTEKLVFAAWLVYKEPS